MKLKVKKNTYKMCYGAPNVQVWNILPVFSFHIDLRDNYLHQVSLEWLWWSVDFVR